MDNYAFRKFQNQKLIKDLINKMLIKNPEQRITTEKALKHQFFVKHNLAESQSYVIKESSKKDNKKDLKLAETKEKTTSTIKNTNT